MSAFGDVHAEKLPPSTEHVNDAETSPVKLIDADVAFVGDDGAPESTGVAGEVGTTVQAKLAGVEVLPAWSVCLTARLCTPSARPDSDRGDEHSA